MKRPWYDWLVSHDSIGEWLCKVVTVFLVGMVIIGILGGW